MFRILYRNKPTSSISKAPQKVHGVKESPLLGQNTILLQSILMELMVSPVFLSASTLRKLEVGMSISDKTLYNVFSIIQEETMINMSRMMQQNMRCSNCNSSLLQRIGTQLYCLQCETINNMFQFQIQMVPITYQPNSRNRRELDMQRKLNAHIRGFICKYGSHCQEQQIRNLRQKLMKIKEMTPNSKGTREAAAVVVYCSLKQQIKMSIADFCKQNNLKQKSFNRKYKVYDKLYNQKREIATQIMIQRQGNQFIKMEQRNEHFEAHSNQQNNIQEKSEQSSSDKIFFITSADCSKGIEIIFDEMFPNFYLKQKKQVIVQKLITKITTIPPQFFSQIHNKALGKPIQLYYLIFAIIKTFGYKINFERYNEIVRNKTGYTLRKSFAFEVKKHYDQFHKKEKQAQSESFELIQVNRIKIQDNSSEVLRIRFPMADSENEFSYQYYFSDQFYN